MPGPPPKRDAERRRRNGKAVETRSVDIADLIKLEVDIPVACEDWHETAIAMYESLSRSGQAIFYEPSDWMTAYVICEQLSRALKPVPMFDADGAIVLDSNGDPMMRSIPMPGAAMNSLLKGLASLMVTEGDRRRLSIELERRRGDVEVAPEGVASISQQRQRRLG
jgi:hypothetical protein